MPDNKTVTFDALCAEVVESLQCNADGRDQEGNACISVADATAIIEDLFKRCTAPTPAAQSAGQEAMKRDPQMTLSGWQLLEALDLIAPDRTTDPDQLDGEIALQMGDERCHSGIGLYAWDAEYPEEGSSFLAGERASETIKQMPMGAADAQQVGGDVEHALLMQNTEYMVKWRNEISKSDKIPTSGEQSSFMDGFESGVRAALSADGGEDKRDAYTLARVLEICKRHKIVQGDDYQLGAHQLAVKIHAVIRTANQAKGDAQ